MRQLFWVAACLAALLGTGMIGRAWAATVNPGDILAIDDQTKTIVRVDPATGAQTVLTVLTTGGLALDLAAEANGRFLIAADGLPEFDPASETVVATAPAAQFNAPFGIAISRTGDVFIADTYASNCVTPGGAVYMIDHLTGAQKTIFTVHCHPRDVAVEASDSVLMCSAQCYLARIDPVTASESACPWNGFHWLQFSPTDFSLQRVAIEASGSILAIAYEGTGPRELVRIDAVTGNVTVVSSGGLFVEPRDLEVAPNGDIFVADDKALPDTSGAQGAIIRVNSVTGTQVVISSGGYFRQLVGIAIAGARNGLVPVRSVTWGQVKARYH
jgi:DNA-binding beta-propeller fold protein YncE